MTGGRVGRGQVPLLLREAVLPRPDVEDEREEDVAFLVADRAEVADLFAAVPVELRPLDPEREDADLFAASASSWTR